MRIFIVRFDLGLLRVIVIAVKDLGGQLSRKYQIIGTIENLIF
jgi:hypothetical protein